MGEDMRIILDIVFVVKERFHTIIFLGLAGLVMPMASYANAAVSSGPGPITIRSQIFDMMFADVLDEFAAAFQQVGPFGLWMVSGVVLFVVLWAMRNSRGSENDDDQIGEPNVWDARDRLKPAARVKILFVQTSIICTRGARPPREQRMYLES